MKDLLNRKKSGIRVFTVIFLCLCMTLTGISPVSYADVRIGATVDDISGNAAVGETEEETEPETEEETETETEGEPEGETETESEAETETETEAETETETETEAETETETEAAAKDETAESTEDKVEDLQKILSWEFIDELEMIVDGEISLGGVSKEQQADFDTIVSLLPTELRVVLEDGNETAVVRITEWICDKFSQDDNGDWPVTGTYSFTAKLEDGFICDTIPSLDVLLGGMMLLNSPETYDIWINGVQVSSANRNNEGNALGTGKIKFTPGTGGKEATLELSGAEIKKYYKNGINQDAKYGSIYSNIPLKIILNGKNIVSGPELSATGLFGKLCGIYSSQDLSITGTGTLDVYSGVGTDISHSPDYDAYGIFCEGDNLNISGDKLIVNAKGGCAIYSEGLNAKSVEVAKGATLNASALADKQGKALSTHARAIYAEDIIVNGGNINAECSMTSGSNIGINCKNLIVGDESDSQNQGGTVVAKSSSSETSASHGIEAVDINVYTGGKVTAVSAQAGGSTYGDCSSFGIQASSSVVVNGGELSATGGGTIADFNTAGIQGSVVVGSAVNSKGGKVTATGGKGEVAASFGAKGEPTYNSSINVYQDGILEATGGPVGNGIFSYGIGVASIAVHQGGTLIATGGSSTSGSFGIRTGNNERLTIDGTDALVKLQGNTQAVKAGLSITIPSGGNTKYIVTAGASADSLDKIDNPTGKNWYTDKKYILIKELSKAKAITSFTVAGQSGKTRLDETEHTIEVDVPFGTDLSALAPILKISDGATVSPLSGVKADFSNSKDVPVTYTVTAENGTTQEYQVRVLHLPKEEKPNGGSGSGSGDKNSNTGKNTSSVTTNTVQTEDGGKITNTVISSVDAYNNKSNVTIEVKTDAQGNVLSVGTEVAPSSQITLHDSQAQMNIGVSQNLLAQAADIVHASAQAPLQVTLSIPAPQLLEQLHKPEIQSIDVQVQIPSSVSLSPNMQIADIKLEKTVIDAAKAEGKNITVSVRDEHGITLSEWSFNGQELKNSTIAVNDLNLAVDIQPVGLLSDKKQELKSAVNRFSQEGMAISFRYSGLLPSKARLKVYSDVKTPEGITTGIKPGDTVYLYSYNPQSKALEAAADNAYTVDADGYVSIQFAYCLDYVLLPNRAGAQTALPAGMADGEAYTIKKGDTLQGIGARYGVSVEQLLAWNPDVSIMDLQIGSQVRIN